MKPTVFYVLFIKYILDSIFLKIINFFKHCTLVWWCVCLLFLLFL